MGVVAKELAVIWKKLDDKKKVKYTKLANAAKVQYGKDMAAYNEKSGN